MARTCALWLALGCTGQIAVQSQAALAPRSAASSEPADAVALAAPSSSARVDCLGGESWRPGATTVCNDQCRAQGFIVSSCIDSGRKETLLQAPCECGPAELSSELAGCRWGQLTLVPQQVVPRSADVAGKVDGCKLDLQCQPGKLTVGCDGEEDGTGTSLCDCYIDGRTLRLPKSDPWVGEGATTCHAAAALCLKVARSAR